MSTVEVTKEIAIRLTGEEATQLAKILIEELDWEDYKYGKFASELHEQLSDAGFGD